jgi:hypothetical protein
MLITCVFQVPGLSNEDFAAVLEGYNYFNDDQDQHECLRWFLQSNNLPQIRDVVITQDRFEYLKTNHSTQW